MPQVRVSLLKANVSCFGLPRLCLGLLRLVIAVH
jgi:hypothetical protein